MRCMCCGDSYSALDRHECNESIRDRDARAAMAALIQAPGEIGDSARKNADKCTSWAYQYADSMADKRRGWS